MVSTHPLPRKPSKLRINIEADAGATASSALDLPYHVDSRTLAETLWDGGCGKVPLGVGENVDSLGGEVQSLGHPVSPTKTTSRFAVK